MPQYSQYTQEELALAQDYLNKSKRLEALEAKVQRDEWDRQLKGGRAYARSAGYSGKKLAALEEFKSEAGILDYGHAIAAFERNQPGSADGDFDWGMSRGVPDDEWKRLLEGDLRGYDKLAIGRALKEAREDMY